MPAALENVFPVSLHSMPSPAHQEVFYTVPRAGHLIAGIHHHIQRNHFPGHELILCVRGRGWTCIEGHRHKVEQGDLLWINCHHPHEHGADPHDPWEVYWIRVEGPRLEQISDLLAVRENPVIRGVDLEAVGSLYHQLFGLLAGEAPGSPASIHAQVAQVLALAFNARQQAGVRTPQLPIALRRPVERMKMFYFESHTVASLSALAELSATHFSRLFKKAFGTSPVDWLRRERINQAKRRLVDTTDAVKAIADQVGYNDRYFFSKDFKKHTGLTPNQFREVETSSQRTV
ncbi:MAG: AraC family transcriptional regulator [Chthoniobacteraceae bacterium]|nr:AraC family transcriptional regulator [Chthoniobacteraceae bacterium]